MHTYTRHARWLVLALIVSLGLSGCYRSVGGSLEPTPSGVDTTSVAQIDTPLPTAVLIEEPTEMAAVPEFTEAVEAPTVEVVTDMPSPIPPTIAAPTDEPTDQYLLPTSSPTFRSPPTLFPSATPTTAAAVFAPSLTPTQQVIVMVPSSTPTPITPTLTATSTASPTPTTPAAVAWAGTPTFTVAVFSTFTPTATYTPYVPPQEGLPLADRPTDQAQAPQDQGGQGIVITWTPIPSESPVEVAQVATLSPNQATATALVYGATATAAWIQGTQMPQLTPLPDQGVPVQPGQPGVIIVTATPFVTPVPANCGQHLISPGETLSRIALTYGVTTAQMAQANNITNPDLIKAGDSLIVPCAVPPTAVPVTPGVPTPLPGTLVPGTGPTVHTVVAGENIYRISLRYGVSMTAIMTANGMSPSSINMIYVGQQLTIPAPAIVPTPVVTLTPIPGNVIIITATPAVIG